MPFADFVVIYRKLLDSELDRELKWQYELAFQKAVACNTRLESFHKWKADILRRSEAQAKAIKDAETGGSKQIIDKYEKLANKILKDIEGGE